MADEDLSDVYHRGYVVYMRQSCWLGLSCSNNIIDSIVPLTFGFIHQVTAAPSTDVEHKLRPMPTLQDSGRPELKRQQNHRHYQHPGLKGNYYLALGRPGRGVFHSKHFCCFWLTSIVLAATPHSEAVQRHTRVVSLNFRPRQVSFAVSPLLPRSTFVRRQSTHNLTKRTTIDKLVKSKMGASVSNQNHGGVSQKTTAVTGDGYRSDEKHAARASSGTTSINRKQDKWNRIATKQQRSHDFASQLLDEAYLAIPVHESTVNAAKLYKRGIHPTSPSSEGMMADPSRGMNQDQSLYQEEQLKRKCRGTLMPGSHKHLGGAYDPTDGCIYGVPANSKAVLCLKPRKRLRSQSVSKSVQDNVDVDETDDCEIDYEMTTIPLPDEVAEYRFKWLRGIFAHGCMWAIPSWAPAVLCVDVDAHWGRRPRQKGKDIVQRIPLPENYPKDGGMEWQWHGAGINHEKTAIFCIPSNAHAVLKVDLIQRTTSLIPIQYDEKLYPEFSTDATNKWYGGIVGHDNCVYGIPYRSCAVLRIDCAKETATLIGPDYGCGHYFWHGGIQVNGKIYAHPSHAATVLVVDTDPTIGSDRERTHELPIRRAGYDTDPRRNYKWLGGSLGLDGNIYCPACDTSSILKIDTTDDTCTTFGFAGTLKNKWQGGVLARDGCVYCIPASGKHVLRIYTGELPNDVENPIQLLGVLPDHKDKWQGGHVGKDGCLYFIPENGYRVLKVIPPKSLPNIVDGKLPEGDVALELL